MPWITKGKKAVPPPHISGPALAGSTPSGTANAPAPVRTHTVGKTAVAADDGGLAFGAQVLFTAHTKVAVTAAFAMPAQTHPIAHMLQPLTWSPTATTVPMISWPGTSG
jgi:hypothetical protein